jgi:hypothetical protein
LTAAKGGMIDIQGGLLAGDGSVGPSLRNAATLAPGPWSPFEPPTADNVGLITVEGSYTQAASAMLVVELAGEQLLDKLRIKGAADLNGTLRVERPGAFIPEVETRFLPVDFDSGSGRFATV